MKLVFIYMASEAAHFSIVEKEAPVVNQIPAVCLELGAFPLYKTARIVVKVAMAVMS